MTLIVRGAVLFLAAGLAGSLSAQTLADLGSAAPGPGTNDIYQLSTQGNQTWPDGLNFYTDDQTGHSAGEPGQTFTTGTNAAGYALTSVAFRTGGLGSSTYNGISTPQPYYLHVYSVAGSTATLLQTYTSGNITFSDGDWLKWTGFSVRLSANATYAYSFGKASSTSGWEPMAVASGNRYAGGEIALISPVNGAMTYGSSHGFDTAFDLGLQAVTNLPITTPLPVPTYGWNLGNSLEAIWGFTYPSAAPFYAAANAGFNAVRIPCAWNFNANQTTYQIDPTYMAQVKQTVDYALAAGMYVVINDHWDGGWLDDNITTNVDPVVNAKMNSYWTQIATTFAGYNNHLLFAAANEPPSDGPDEVRTMMFYYQTFVNAVRGVGGNNTNRWLVLQGSGDTAWLNALPTDPTPNRLMVEYHNYTPWQFTQMTSDQPWGNMFYFWGPAYHYSGNPSRNATWGEEGYIDSGFQQLTDQYVSKGIPVMVGEFQAAAKSFLVGTEATYNRASALYWNKYLVDSAIAHGLSPFYWSTPNSPFDMNTGAVYDPQVVSVLTGGTAPPPNGAPYAPSGLTATASNSQITLSWTAGSGATSYNLRRTAESGYESTNPVVAGITGTSYTDTNLNSGTTYYYLVAAVNSFGPSGFSPEAHATTPGVNPDPAQFHFETDPQRWSARGSQISGVATSNTRDYAGNQSLAVNFNGATAGTSSANVNDVTINTGTTITFRVWIPSGSPITTVEPYLQDYNWAWSQSWYGSLAANAWNTLTLTVPSTATTPLKLLGIRFTTSAAWTGTCYVDSVSWTTAAPDFTLAADPPSLTVPGGTNGTSTITVTAINGLNGVYTFSASNLPNGVTATFATNPITGGATTLTLTASNTVVSGTSNVTITATCGLLSHTTTIALTLNGVTPPNTPPALAAIPNRTVNVGQTVAFTASATDTDQPPQMLTYALLAGSTNATLNTNSGAFSFRPLVTQANSTNNFMLKVSDDGSPSLSATQSFAVVVNPLSTPGISNVSAAGGHFSFSVSGQSGPDYAAEASTNLTQWSTVFVTNSPALPFVWTDTNSAVPRRFYRVKLGPPLP